MTRISWRRLLPVVGVLLVAAPVAAEPEAPPPWDPAGFAAERTLELLTVGPEEGEHWSTVWLVVIDGDVYIRLGSRAAGRIERNTTRPFVAVRIAGRRFERVRAEEKPAMVERVAAAMGEKYWSDPLVRLMAHPLTLRLVPGPQAIRSPGSPAGAR